MGVVVKKESNLFLPFLHCIKICVIYSAERFVYQTCMSGGAVVNHSEIV